MQIHEMNETECCDVLSRTSMGRLGCSHDAQPYVVPIYFAYEAAYVYAFSTPGQKIEWMRANPRICLQVDEIKQAFEWCSVIANGRYEELSETRYPDESAHARALLSKRGGWWLNALAERRTKEKDNPVGPLFFRMHLESVSGLRAEPEK